MADTYIPTLYVTSEALVRDAAAQLARNIAAAEDLIRRAVQLSGDITRWAETAPVGYADGFAEIERIAAENPSDPAWQALAAQIAKLKAEAETHRERMVFAATAVQSL